MPDAVIGGRYRLLERLATGGMGSVWKAWDERLQRTVAVKQLHLQRGLSEHDAYVATQRVLREARNAARLHHPNAVHVFDVVDDNGRPCLVLQYVPSTSLQQIVRTQGPRPVAEVARIGTQLAAALAAAHRAGIVHRDVKPGNILIGDDGTAKLTDFGISHASGDPALTSTGMLTGTPAYLSPEVARGAASSPASDVFSLASTLFMAAEGAPPFGTDQNPIAVLHRVASGNATPATRLGPLEPLLRRMMSPDPAARPDMVEVANELATLPSRQGATPTVEPRRAPMVVPAPPMAAEPLPLIAGPLPRRERTSSFVVPFLAAVLVVALGTVLAIALIRNGTGGGASGSGASPVGQASLVPTASRTRPTAPATSRATSKPAHPTRSASKVATTAPTASRSTAPQSTAPQSTAPQPTAQQLAQAITDYYSLVPGNTRAGWKLLTDRYRRTTAEGRLKYEQFWGKMRRVTVSQIVVALPGTVTATLTYFPQKGRKAVNRTRFALVRDGGVLKIDASRVL